MLLCHLGACSQPIVSGASGGKLLTLLQVAWRALPAWMAVGVLLDREVPDVPGVRAVIPQHRLLGARGKKTVPGHANTVSTSTDIPREVTRRPSPT